MHSEKDKLVNEKTLSMGRAVAPTPLSTPSCMHNRLIQQLPRVDSQPGKVAFEREGCSLRSSFTCCSSIRASAFYKRNKCIGKFILPVDVLHSAQTTGA